jgi:flagellar basal-body rod modification protein FlgD
MISATGSSTSSSMTGTTSIAGGNSAINKDQFLQLLVTQLRHQDPLSPLQPDQFAAQLAQFSSVEQLTRLNTAVDAQSQSLALQTMMAKTNFSASLIGRQVLAEGNSVAVGSSGTGRVNVDIGGAGGIGVLRILDSKGVEVARREEGPLRPGRQSVPLPVDVPPGDYTYVLDVKDAAGKAVPVSTYTTGIVQAVKFDAKSGILLSVAGKDIPLDSLAEIEPVS